MSEPFVGEIRMFAGNFAPRGWAFCDGQLLAVSQNDALFSLYGTVYGGDGRQTFGLPDLRGRVPLHQGQGPGLSQRNLGSKGGDEAVTLVTGQLPAHSHDLVVSDQLGNQQAPTGQTLAKISAGSLYKTPPVTTNPAMAADAIGEKGGSGSHANLMPTLCVHFIVALIGIYPSRQ